MSYSWTSSNPLLTFADSSYNFLQYILGNWSNISCNSSGDIVAINTYLPLNNIFLSNNHGNSWINITTPIGNVNLVSAAIDSTGEIIALAAIRHGLYVTNDAGTTWDEVISGSSADPGNQYNTNFSCITSSLGGQIILTGNTGGGNSHLYLSTTVDASFNSVLKGNYNFTGVAVNSTGTIMAACATNYCFISTNTGTTWTNLSLPPYTWSGISMDSSGTNIVLCSLNGYIYVSNNTGNTWTSCAPSSLTWSSIYISSDASTIFACAINDNIYYSINNGTTWTMTSPNGVKSNWSSICCNNNGSYVYACVNGGNIYTGRN